MELHGESGAISVPDPFAGPIIDVNEPFLGKSRIDTVGNDRIAMVLAGNVHPSVSIFLTG